MWKNCAPDLEGDSIFPAGAVGGVGVDEGRCGGGAGGGFMIKRLERVTSAGAGDEGRMQ